MRICNEIEWLNFYELEATQFNRNIMWIEKAIQRAQANKYCNNNSQNISIKLYDREF